MCRLVILAASLALTVPSTLARPHEHANDTPIEKRQVTVTTSPSSATSATASPSASPSSDPDDTGGGNMPINIFVPIVAIIGGLMLVAIFVSSTLSHTTAGLGPHHSKTFALRVANVLTARTTVRQPVPVQDIETPPHVTYHRVRPVWLRRLLAQPHERQHGLGLVSQCVDTQTSRTAREGRTSGQRQERSEDRERAECEDAAAI
jgi:hypothetical protein